MWPHSTPFDSIWPYLILFDPIRPHCTPWLDLIGSNNWIPIWPELTPLDKLIKVDPNVHHSKIARNIVTEIVAMKTMMLNLNTQDLMRSQVNQSVYPAMITAPMVVQDLIQTWMERLENAPDMQIGVVSLPTLPWMDGILQTLLLISFIRLEFNIFLKSTPRSPSVKVLWSPWVQRRS